MLAAIEKQVHFARRRARPLRADRFCGCAVRLCNQWERTLEAFYERVQSWASPFMALFGREGLPSRSALSRFLAALDQAAVEA